MSISILSFNTSREEIQQWPSLQKIRERAFRFTSSVADHGCDLEIGSSMRNASSEKPQQITTEGQKELTTYQHNRVLRPQGLFVD